MNRVEPNTTVRFILLVLLLGLTAAAVPAAGEGETTPCESVLCHFECESLDEEGVLGLVPLLSASSAGRFPGLPFTAPHDALASTLFHPPISR